MSLKDINIKNHTGYFLDDIINIKDFDPNNVKVDEESNKKFSCLLYWICDDQKRPKNLQCK